MEKTFTLLLILSNIAYFRKLHLDLTLKKDFFE